MDFDEIIEALYSGDQSLICDALNTGGYISDFNDYCDTEAIHTGFYCRVQTGTIFEAIYLISKQTNCIIKSIIFIEILSTWYVLDVHSS
ncbi:hypothetical protein NXX40_20460 [Parabacteroides distasonis]|nr:hypothetical protein [Parabacteroides distasonis]